MRAGGRRSGAVAALALCVAVPAAARAPAAAPSPFAGLAEQEAAIRSGTTSSEALVRAALARVEALDRRGPRLNSVITLNPAAAADARRLDRDRRTGRSAGPLEGLPILLKDNIDVVGLPTTAGSLALVANWPARDAGVTARLRDAGAVVLGKANLSEWANFRSTGSLSGWSAVGGLTRNPYALDRGTCGSSSGSAVAVAAGIVAGAVGTETDGSITCPAAMNGVVGFKPTLGLLSRAGVVPISAEQDTPGPIARSVADAARLLTAMGGEDAADPAALRSMGARPDFEAALNAGALRGARLGVLRWNEGRSPRADAVFARALERLRRAGAVLVEVEPPTPAERDALDAAESAALRAEFRPALEGYLARTPAAVKTRSLADLIAFDRRTPEETALFGQDIFEQAALPAPDGLEQRARARRLATALLDRLLSRAGAVALVGLSNGPAPVVDLVNGSKWLGSYATIPAVAGAPHLSVPMGQVAGLPVGLSLIGRPGEDARILSLGYAFEQAGGPNFVPPSFRASAEAGPALARALDPP